MEVSFAIQRYLRHQRTGNASAETLKWHGQSLSQFLAHTGNLDLSALDADHLRDFLDALSGRGLKVSTIGTRARSLKAFGKWLVAEEYLSKDPFSRVRRPREDEPPHDYFTPEEVQRLLGTCDRTTLVGTRDYAILLLLYSTGLRCSEAVNLTRADIDLSQQLITVRRGKGGKFRQVPLTRPVEKALLRYLDHRKRAKSDHLFLAWNNPLSAEALKKLVVRKGQLVGVHAHPHKFRHSCAIQYLRNGGRVEVLQRLLGHTKIEMTLHYARLAGVDVVRGHESFDPVSVLRGQRSVARESRS